jgi:hypothetical protein
MGRNYLWFGRGDAANAILAAVGYNFRRLIRWLSILWRLILCFLLAALQPCLSERDVVHRRQIKFHEFSHSGERKLSGLT